MRIEKVLALRMLSRITAKLGAIVDEHNSNNVAKRTLRGIACLAAQNSDKIEAKDILSIFKKWQQFIVERRRQGVEEFLNDPTSLERWAEVGLRRRISMANNTNIDKVVEMEREQAPQRTNESNMYQGRNTKTM